MDGPQSTELLLAGNSKVKDWHPERPEDRFVPCNNIMCKAPWPNTDESHHTPTAQCKGHEEREARVSKAICLFHCGATSGLINVVFQLPPSCKWGKLSSSCRLLTDEVMVSCESRSVVMILLGRESTPCPCQLLPTVVTVWPISFLKIKLGPVWSHQLFEIYGSCGKNFFQEKLLKRNRPQ